MHMIESGLDELQADAIKILETADNIVLLRQDVTELPQIADGSDMTSASMHHRRQMFRDRVEKLRGSDLATDILPRRGNLSILPNVALCLIEPDIKDHCVRADKGSLWLHDLTYSGLDGRGNRLFARGIHLHGARPATALSLIAINDKRDGGESPELLLRATTSLEPQRLKNFAAYLVDVLRDEQRVHLK